MKLVHSSIVTLALCSAAFAQSFAQKPVPVTDGPLLFLESYIEVDDQRWNLHHVCDPRSGEPAREFLRLHGNLDVAHRFGRDLILVKSYHEHRGLLLLDLGSGGWRQMSKNNPHELVAVRGDTVVYVAEDGYLKAHGIEPDATPRKLLKQPVQRVVNGDGSDVVVLTAGAKPEIWVVPITGKPRKVVAADPQWESSMLTAQVAPDRRHLALGVVNQDEAFSRGGVLVLSLEDSREVWREAGISIAVSPLSSFTPSVKLGWRDPDTVRFSASELDDGDVGRGFVGKMVWVDLDIHSGERVGRHVYGPLSLYHADPDDPILRMERYTDGMFEREPGRLYHKGAKKPLVDVRNQEGRPRWSDLAVAPGGQWACAVFHDESTRIELVDGEHGVLRTVLPTWAYDLTWLP